MTEIFPSEFITYVAFGENSGTLTQPLAECATALSVTVDTANKRLIGLMSPLLIIALGLMIATGILASLGA